MRTKTHDNLLINRLGIKSGTRLYLKNAPSYYYKLLLPLPDDVKLLKRLSKNVDLFHLFCRNQDEANHQIEKVLLHMKPTGIIWLS
ncbi:MAG: hypothetical protein R2865_07745 [Deinococcales bacterium]